jgi:hypothetical protein
MINERARIQSEARWYSGSRFRNVLPIRCAGGSPATTLGVGRVAVTDCCGEEASVALTTKARASRSTL